MTRFYRYKYIIQYLCIMDMTPYFQGELLPVDINDPKNPVNSITHDIIGAAFEVRKHCGKGLLENYYESALAYELQLKGHKVDRQVMVPAFYKGIPVKDPYKIDILVDESVVVELKSLPYVTSHEFSQLSTYLWLTKLQVGLLINFSAQDFRPGAWDQHAPNYNLGIIRVVRSQ